MPNKKRKVLQYRKAVISDKSQTLYSLLLQALQKLPLPADRSLETAKGEDSFRLINNHKPTEKMIFGEFVCYEKGTSQPILSRDVVLEGTHFPVKHLQMKDVPKEFSGKDADFVNSVLYFAVFRNHVILAPTQQIRIDLFEKYLSWLLGVQSGVLAPGVSFNLRVGLRKENDQETTSPIVSMEIGGAMRAVETEDGGLALEPSSSEALTVQNTASIGVGRGLIVNLLKSMGVYSNTWDTILNGGDVTARLIIKSSSKKAEDNRKLFTNLQETCYRNLPPEDIVYKRKDGKTVRGETLMLSKPVYLQATRDGFISPDELYAEMNNWLTELIQNEGILNEDQVS